MAATETVHDRVDIATETLSAAQIAAGLAFVALAGFALLFAQDPMVHDAMHDFRHVAGVACH